MDDDRRPVLVGVGQQSVRDAAPAEAPSPLDLLESVARAALDDAGVSRRGFGELDTLALIDVIAWRPANGPRLLAERLGASPRRELVSAVGGEIPLVVVNRIAREIAAGGARLALVAGANNVRTLRRARNARVKLEWPQGGAGRPEEIGVTLPGSSPAETEYGLGRPAHVYPIFENALRARRGLDLAAHRRRMGELMSRFTRVAAKNPFAWFPVERSAEEIVTPTASNRMIAFPYTKYMNSVIETDQAAAVLIASRSAARELGIPEARQVSWWGGGDAREAEWYASERPDFARCPALAHAVEAALDEAGLALDELAYLDFYSCFPSAVEMACEMLGLREDDPRGLTVTGGLPYAGGPGNAYTLHALATLVQRLREQPGASGLVTGNGWYLTKHSATLLASRPREGTPGPTPAPAVSPPLPPEPRSTDPATGAATLETYTVLFDRDGAPERGIALGRTAEGRRFLANTPDAPELLEAFVREDPIGRPGRLRHEDGRNLFDPR